MPTMKKAHFIRSMYISESSPQISSFEFYSNAVPSCSPPLSTLALRWLENVRLRVKESTYVKYYNITQNHILPKLGTHTADQLTTEVVEQFVHEKLVHGRSNGNGGLSVHGK